MARTRQQEFVSSFTHGAAGVVAIAGMVVLIVLSALYQTPWHVVGFSVYGASLVTLYAVSFLYHFVNALRGYHKRYQSLDYAMISVLIAGTYTPVTLIPLRGGWGWALFGVIWFMAITSIALRLATPLFKGWVPAVYYLLMGWLIIIAIGPLSAALSTAALWWLFIGGIFYTLGTGFFALERFVRLSSRFGMHELFHVFVVLGSVSHFVMMYRYVLIVQ
ncbi:MAG: hemolysin III family protein [Patescibacteria group bacterium]